VSSFIFVISNNVLNNNLRSLKKGDDFLSIISSLVVGKGALVQVFLITKCNSEYVNIILVIAVPFETAYVFGIETSRSNIASFGYRWI